jgi:hypothetical protein
MDKNIEIGNKILEDNYYEEPYNIDDKPIVSYLICVRTLRGITEKDSLYSLLNSFISQVPEQDWNKVEFLIKFDVDDTVAIVDWVIGDNLRTRFPKLNIRVFAFHRWEGRRSIYLNYWYLFTRRNISSKFIGFLTDDVTFQANPLYHIEKHLDKEYVMLSHVHNREVLHSIKDWELETTRWSCGSLTEPYPTVSVKILEICGSMGFQSNIDNWFALINVILYCKYKIDLYYDVPNVFHRNSFSDMSFNPTNFLPSKFNEEWLVDDSKPSNDSYYYCLVEKQADNIYLNMKIQGIIQ